MQTSLAHMVTRDAMQPVGQDVFTKLQAKKEQWRRQCKLDAVEHLLWGKHSVKSIKQRLCCSATRVVSSLLQNAALALDDISITIALGPPAKV